MRLDFRRLIKPFLLLAPLALLASGCGLPIFGSSDRIWPQGNGSGYNGLTRRSFYWLDPSYRCVPSSGGESIASYRDSIDVFYDRNQAITSAIAKGDLCTPKSEVIPVALVQPTAASSLVGYGQGTYQFSEAPPPPTQPAVEALCSSLLGGSHPVIDLTLTLDPSSGARQSSVRIAGSSGQFSSLVQSESATQRLYTGSTFQLAIRIDDVSAVDPDKFSAVLEATVGGTAYSESVVCRITPIPPALVHPPSTASTALYVSADGVDTAACTKDAPCRQLRRALALASAGKNIVVTDGQYVGFDVTGVSATSGAPVRIQASGSGALVVPSTDRADNQDSIVVSNSSFVSLEGFRIEPGNRNGVKVMNSSNVTLRNLIVQGQPSNGILASVADDITVESCELAGNDSGMVVDDSWRAVLRGNLVHDNDAMGILIQGTTPGRGIIDGALLESNRFYANSAGGSSALSFDGVQNATVRNNLFYSNFRRGFSIYKITASSGSQGLQILNNTFVMPSGSDSALRIVDTVGANTVRNNILLHQDANGAGLELDPSVSLATLSSQNNALQTIRRGASTYTLASWRLASPSQEIHSISAAVSSFFVDLVNLDFDLASSSPAIDAGQDLPNVTTDILGRARPARARTDIGAFELP